MALVSLRGHPKRSSGVLFRAWAGVSLTGSGGNVRNGVKADVQAVSGPNGEPEPKLGLFSGPDAQNSVREFPPRVPIGPVRSLPFYIVVKLCFCCQVRGGASETTEALPSRLHNLRAPDFAPAQNEDPS